MVDYKPLLIVNMSGYNENQIIIDNILLIVGFITQNWMKARRAPMTQETSRRLVYGDQVWCSNGQKHLVNLGGF